MSVATEPHRDLKGQDEQALKEIRDLFSRYRRLARHGMVSDRFDRGRERDPDETPADPEPAPR
jgi:hypothetical protein